MKNFIKTTALTLCASLLFSVSAFAKKSAPESIYPVRSTLEENGFTVTYSFEENAVKIAKGDFSLTEKIGDNIFYIEHLNDGITYAKSSFFDTVYSNCPNTLKTSGVVTEIGDNYILASTEAHGDVIFIVNENTNFHHDKNKMTYRISDVETGMTLTFVHSEAMTLSLPPMTSASEVIFSDSENEPLPDVSVDVVVKEVGDDYILAEVESGDMKFLVSDETNIRHMLNKRAYRLSDIKVGMSLTITHKPQVTFSIPPQTPAVEVVITSSPEDFE